MSFQSSHHRSLESDDLLTAEQERELGTRSLGGDLEARNALVVANLRLVKSMAWKFRKEDFDDLVGAGNIGLIMAAERYDPSFGRFTTYATYWIRQGVFLYLSMQKGVKKHIHWECRKLIKHCRITGRDAKKLSLDEASEVLDSTPEHAGFIIDTLNCQSLSNPQSDSDGVDYETPADIVERRDIGDFMLDRLRYLPERSATILKMHYGIGCEPRTFAQIGEVLGVSRQRVQQLEEKAINSLRSIVLFDPRSCD